MVFVNSNSHMQKKKLLTNWEIFDILSTAKKKEIKEVFQIEEKNVFLFQIAKVCFSFQLFLSPTQPPSLSSVSITW